MWRTIVCLVLMTPTVQAEARFTEHAIADGLTGGYQVIITDMNHDGKPDLIALASGLRELSWYENPGWQKHVIVSGIQQPINVAVVRMGDDGVPVLALAHEFSPNAAKSAGVVSILEHKGDTWIKTDIDRLPTSHRLRMLNGWLINAPLTNAEAKPPDYRGAIPLVAYHPGDWKRRLITDADEGVLHCIYPVDWDGKGREALLTASFQGIHLIRSSKDGSFERTKLTGGSPAPWPKSGASDVAVGVLGKVRFLASIEPWHGNEVAVYTESKGAWAREVIDSSLVDGHTLVAADLDGNGRSVILAGYRGKGASVNLYRFDGKAWVKSVLDNGGMAGAGCAVGDLNGDGRLDIACIGTSTANLKWYENR